jgi:hypothetical protein
LPLQQNDTTRKAYKEIQEVSPKLPGLEKVYEALEAVVKENAAKGLD